MYDKKFISTTLLLVVALAGCGGFKLKQYSHLSKRESDYAKQKDDVEIRVRKLTRKECPTSSFVPLFITVRNNSLQSVIFDDSNIHVETASVDRVYNVLSKSPAGRVFFGAFISTGVSAALPYLLSCIPYGCLGCVSGFYPVYRAAIFAATMSGVVGGTMAGVRAADYNGQLRSYLETHMLKTIKVAAGTKKTRLVFVPKRSYSPIFSLDVIKLIKKDSERQKQLVHFNIKM
jgi:hypothetical protein